MIDRGFTMGPTLRPDQSPWGFWEQDPAIDNGHKHQWESVLLQGNSPQRRRTEEVIRCSVCHCPRCGYSRDPDPCMNRRHHADDHRLLSGHTYPLGGTR